MTAGGTAAAPLAVALVMSLSPERLVPYQRAAGGALPDALRLYRWNAAVGAALHEDLGTVEVVVRNALSRALQQRHDRDGWDGGWWTDPERLLDTRARAEIAAAGARATRDGRDAGPGRLIAALGFGFWAQLLAARHEDVLWLPALRGAFPHLGGAERADAYAAVAGLGRLRNRVAHHEPLHTEPLAEAHASLLGLVAMICPATAAWTGRTSRVPALLGQRPAAPARAA